MKSDSKYNPMFTLWFLKKHTILRFILFFLLSLPIFSIDKTEYNTSFMLLDYAKQKPVFFDEVIRGNNVLINFWATYCEPCKKEIPIIVQKFSNNKKIKLVFINLDEKGNNPKVQEFIIQYNIANHSYLDPYQVAAKELLKPKTAIPANLVIDKKGNILLNLLGFRETTIEEISQVIGKLK